MKSGNINADRFTPPTKPPALRRSPSRYRLAAFQFLDRLVFYPVMHVTLYILRENGRPLTYAEVKARPRPQGRLVLGTWGNPEVHAKLLGDGPEMNAPKPGSPIVSR